MRVELKFATADDVEDLVSLHSSVSQRLTSLFGKGHWSTSVTERGVLFAMRISKIHVFRSRRKLTAALTLSTRKPWAIDKGYFGPCETPLYLTGMSVAVSHQSRGIGRLCIKQVGRIAGDWPSKATRLDAYNSLAGAGEFYRKCGFREVGSVS